jgi:hypothetical protein
MCVTFVHSHAHAIMICHVSKKKVPSRSKVVPNLITYQNNEIYSRAYNILYIMSKDASL